MMRLLRSPFHPLNLLLILLRRLIVRGSEDINAHRPTSISTISSHPTVFITTGKWSLGTDGWVGSGLLVGIDSPVMRVVIMAKYIAVDIQLVEAAQYIGWA